MSTGKRILDLLKANINALLDKAGAPPDTAVGQMTDAELEAELHRRKERKAREENERHDREQAEKAARERAAQRAFESMKARAAGGEVPPPRTNGSTARKPPPGQQKRSTAPPPRHAPPGTERRLRDLYAQLEVPYGSPFDEVKKSFRRLMRKYHPDLHAGNPTKHKTATQLTMSLTAAYNELEEHLVGGPNKQK